jgi:RND family efflux transporter MFP subunit
MKPFLPIANLIKFLMLVSATTLFAENGSQIVSITPLSSILVSTKNSAPANIISLNNSTISAEITGRALKIYVEVGETVNKDQNLVSLDCRSYTLAKKQADAALKVGKAQLNLAKKELLRNQRLIKNGTIPRELFDKTEANQKTALADIDVKKAAIETARLAIDRCTIKAPFVGQITQRMIQNGQLVIAGTPLFQLMESDKMEIKSNLSPADIAKLNKTTELVFVSANKYIKSKLRSVVQSIDQATRTQEVRLSILNDSELAAGLSGRIEWNNKEKKLPAEYLQRRNTNLGVMIAVDIIEGTGKAKFITLDDAIEGQPASIHLPINTAIINKNHFRVDDGQTIHVHK